LIGDAVKIGHDKIYLLSVINALHPELDSVPIDLAHQFRADRDGHAAVLRRGVRMAFDYGIELGAGTVDGLIVQGKAWHEASDGFALRAPR
jgi:hypothetical protein